jgi:hypothetical protein
VYVSPQKSHAAFLRRTMIPRHPRRGQQRNGVHHEIKALIVYHKQTQSFFNTCASLGANIRSDRQIYKIVEMKFWKNN